MPTRSVAFTGHMVDRPSRPAPRFPAARAEEIGRRIEEEVRRLGVRDGFASGASGGDILFHEAVLRAGGRIHVVLPCNKEDFVADCVETGAEGGWGERFARVWEAAATTEILGDQYAADNAMASECCNRVVSGLMARSAAAAGDEPALLALWNGEPGDAAGGSHSMVEYALGNGIRVRLMADLAPNAVAQARDLRPRSLQGSSAIRGASADREPAQEICAVVFVDAVGFSKLRERELPAFCSRYLSEVMAALSAREIVPLARNTWGDGLFLVFDRVEDAGLFALDFRERIVRRDWQAEGLPATMSVRIGIHVGPLYRIYDPVLGHWNYVGSNVTRAARIEPSTPKGEVFASLPFAAIAAAEGVTTFTCTDVGRIKLAKDYDVMQAFRLEWAGRE